MGFRKPIMRFLGWIFCCVSDDSFESESKDLIDEATEALEQVSDAISDIIEDPEIILEKNPKHVGVIVGAVFLLMMCCCCCCLCRKKKRKTKRRRRNLAGKNDQKRKGNNRDVVIDMDKLEKEVEDRVRRDAVLNLEKKDGAVFIDVREPDDVEFDEFSKMSVMSRQNSQTPGIPPEFESRTSPEFKSGRSMTSVQLADFSTRSGRRSRRTNRTALELNSEYVDHSAKEDSNQALLDAMMVNEESRECSVVSATLQAKRLVRRDSRKPSRRPKHFLGFWPGRHGAKKKT